MYWIKINTDQREEIVEKQKYQVKPASTQTETHACMCPCNQVVGEFQVGVGGGGWRKKEEKDWKADQGGRHYTGVGGGWEGIVFIWLRQG